MLNQEKSAPREVYISEEERQKRLERNSKIEIWALLRNISRLDEKILQNIFGNDIFVIDDILKKYNFDEAVDLYNKYKNSIHQGDIIEDTSNNDQYYVLQNCGIITAIKILDKSNDPKKPLGFFKDFYPSDTSIKYIKTDKHYDYIHIDNKAGTVCYGNI